MDYLLMIFSKFYLYDRLNITLAILVIYLISFIIYLKSSKNKTEKYVSEFYIHRFILLIVTLTYLFLSFWILISTSFGYAGFLVTFLGLIGYGPIVIIYLAKSLVRLFGKNNVSKLDLRFIPQLILFQIIMLIFNLYDCGDCGGPGNIPMPKLQGIIFIISYICHLIYLSKFIFSHFAIRLENTHPIHS